MDSGNDSSRAPTAAEDERKAPAAPARGRLKHILIVDDEQNVLDGLRNILRRERARWEIVFALGGEAALAQLAAAPFDVLLTDMRMPGIDGVELLTRAKQAHPEMTRIVLSGHADRDTIVRTLSVAHQFLDKPCPPERLCAALERACALQPLLRNEAIRSVVGRLDRLPSVPRVYTELTELVARSDASLEQVAEIVERDPAMCVKLLQLVNSAYFGLAQRTASVHQAVSFLGIDLVRVLTLSAHIFSAEQGATVAGLSLDELQQHSLRVSALARQFLAGSPLASDAQTAGIVHEMGRVVLAQGMPERYAELARQCAHQQRPLHLAERECFGVSHAEIGAYLLGIWGLPAGIVEVVACHHTLEQCSPAARPVLAALHVANLLADLKFEAAPGALVARLEGRGLDRAFLELAGCGGRLEQWCALAAASRAVGGAGDR